MSAAAPARVRQVLAFDRAGLALTVIAFAVALVWAYPLFWMVGTSFAGNAVIGTSLDAVRQYWLVFQQTRMLRWYVNSLITAAGVTVVLVAISAACGYAISQIRFRGRHVLWYTILASFMIPVQALIISHFFLMYRLGLINTWLGVILPQLIAPISVIVYKQFFDQMPREFAEAARIDGAGHTQILFRIFLPINWGVTAALAIVNFIAAWNAFLWPFLAVTREEMMNVSVAIGVLSSAFGLSFFAVTLLAGLPVALVYLVFQRQVTRAIVLSAGIKG